VAAEAQALDVAGATGSSGGGFTAAAKNFIKPSSLKDLITKPGAVVSMLKAITNALKLRWPAFMGTNVLLSLGLFVLLFVFWYCHKRGRETRLERERVVDSEGRIIELEDDAMLDEAGPERSHTLGNNSSRTPSHDHSHRDVNDTGSHSDRRPSSSRRDRTRERSSRRRSSEHATAGERR